MGQKILAKRETPQHKNTVAGILDGDFLKEWKPPEGKPQVWQISENHRIFTLGWRWERIEIENYLVDPIVIEKTIGKDRIDLIQYKQALEQARNDIAAYQAARTALSANRRRLKILKSCFGSERGKEKHHFPNDLSTPSCEEGIKNTVASHREEQFINEKDVIESFGHYRKECLPDGIRYQHYLHTFSGKDLFWAMDGWLRKNRFQGAS
ncbi:MAG TPA: hypothetical protein HPQ00_02145, partial [Magnetococcales bacterium]|nr:hypothetical protein [Magnetococcales bacterium]